MDISREEASAVRPVLSLGRYVLFREMATGGMATVHYGRMRGARGSCRTVAIKRMRPDIARDPDYVAMFLEEARLASHIVHPNVVATIDMVDEAGELFLVMEYVRGESLMQLGRLAKARHERLPVPVAVRIMIDTLLGLHAAHEAAGEDGDALRIVHRDVSPYNILVGEDGVARISDFGIAKADGRLQVKHERQMKGRLDYMAPEQLGTGPNLIDRRVDIFSTAVVLWELLSGKTLFRAHSPGRTIANVLSAPVPPLRPLRAEVTLKLDRVVRRALSRSPDERPETAEVFARELGQVLEHGPASPRLVANWVWALAGDDLATRANYEREIESTSWHLPDRTQAPQTPPPAPSPARQVVPPERDWSLRAEHDGQMHAACDAAYGFHRKDASSSASDENGRSSGSSNARPGRIAHATTLVNRSRAKSYFTDLP